MAKKENAGVEGVGIARGFCGDQWLWAVSSLELVTRPPGWPEGGGWGVVVLDTELLPQSVWEQREHFASSSGAAGPIGPLPRLLRLRDAFGSRDLHPVLS